MCQKSEFITISFYWFYLFDIFILLDVALLFVIYHLYIEMQLILVDLILSNLGRIIH